jgi:hypothetical protein
MAFFFPKTRELLIKYYFSRTFLQNGDFGDFFIFNSFFALFFLKNKREFLIKYSSLKIFLTKWRFLGIFGQKNYLIFGNLFLKTENL